MNNNTKLYIKYNPPREDFTIEVFFEEDNKNFEISIFVNESLVYSKEHDLYNDLVITKEKEYEKYSYSIEEILNLTNLRGYVHI